MFVSVPRKDLDFQRYMSKSCFMFSGLRWQVRFLIMVEVLTTTFWINAREYWKGKQLTIQRNQQYGWHKTKKKKSQIKTHKNIHVLEANTNTASKTWILPQDMSPSTRHEPSHKQLDAKTNQSSLFIIKLNPLNTL